MSNAIIRAALESRLKTWAAAQAPPIPIAFQNTAFTPPNQARYLRAFLLPAETRSDDGPGETRTYLGIFQVTVVVPEGSGPAGAELVTSGLEALFPMALLINRPGLNIMTIRPASAGTSLQEPGAYSVPVSIRYRADTT